MKLGASLAVCLPASAILLPSLTASVKSRGTTAIGVISRDRLVTSSELRASVSASWILDDPTSVRESLINSEDFQALVERLEVLSSSLDDDTCTEELPGDANAVEALTCQHSESGMAATSANTVPSRAGKEEEEIVRKSWVRRNRWERNADKLESLRMTVLESRKARSIAAAVRAVKDSSRSASTGSLHAASQMDPSALASNTEEAVQEIPSPFSNDGVWGPWRTNGPTEDIRDGNWRGIRWVRNAASRVATLGRRAEGRIARLVWKGRTSAVTEEHDS